MHCDGKHGRGRFVAIFGRTLVSACSDRNGSPDNASNWPSAQVPSRSQNNSSRYQAREHNVDVTWHVDLLSETGGLRTGRDSPITKWWSIGIKGGYRRLSGARNPRGTRTGSTLGHLVSWLSSVRDADSKSTLSYVGLKWIKIFESFQTKQSNLRQSRFRTYRIAGWLTMQRFVGQNASQEAREATDNRGSDAAPVLWLRLVVIALHCSWILNLWGHNCFMRQYNLKSNRPKELPAINRRWNLT